MVRKYSIAIIVFLLIISIAFAIYKAQDLKRMYKAEVAKVLKNALGAENKILTEADIKHLPEPVQKYLIYVGAIGKEKVRNFKIVFDG